MSETCYECKFVGWNSIIGNVVCYANPPQRGNGNPGFAESWINPVVLETRPACRFFQPRENTPTTADNDTKPEMNQITNPKEEN